MQDTRETAATTADRPLTIDTNRLGDLWLPEYRTYLASVKYMEAVCKRSAGKKTSMSAIVARNAVCDELLSIVMNIKQRGGLLLIGGAK